MTFEEWWAKAELCGIYYGPTKQAWDAATYAANARAGDASNEAEKDARRKVAVMQIAVMHHWDAEQMDLIIQKAQG